MKKIVLLNSSQPGSIERNSKREDKDENILDAVLYNDFTHDSRLSLLNACRYSLLWLLSKDRALDRIIHRHRCAACSCTMTTMLAAAAAAAAYPRSRTQGKSRSLLRNRWLYARHVTARMYQTPQTHQRHTRE